jgi:hypothetical protein
MNLEELAVSLKLPKESTEAVVFDALAKRDAEGRTAVESLSALTGQLPGFGIQLDGTKLVRLAPVTLDLEAKPEDDAEKVALKKALAEAEQAKAVAKLSSNAEFVTKLAADLKLPPAMIELSKEILSVQGELQALTLSKDGKVQMAKCQNFPDKVKSLLSQLAFFKGVKLSTPDGGKEALSDEEAAKKEREKLAKEVVASVNGK